MEFRFNINEIFKNPIVEIDQSLIPKGFNGDRRALRGTVEKVSEVINAIGTASAAAQGLNKSITTAERLRNCDDQTVFLLVDQNAKDGKGVITGMLKTGKKSLYLVDENGQHYKVTPPCLLDFYIHESRQRSGFGKQLFQHMLEKQQLDPSKLAIDRPSDKLLKFLNKHYNLSKAHHQMNNYVVFDGFFPQARDTSEGAYSNDSSPMKTKYSANGLQTFGRYGAPRPPCSMGQIIHQENPVQSNETSGIKIANNPVQEQQIQRHDEPSATNNQPNLQNAKVYPQNPNNLYQGLNANINSPYQYSSIMQPSNIVQGHTNMQVQGQPIPQTMYQEKMVLPQQIYYQQQAEVPQNLNYQQQIQTTSNTAQYIPSQNTNSIGNNNANIHSDLQIQTQTVDHMYPNQQNTKIPQSGLYQQNIHQVLPQSIQSVPRTNNQISYQNPSQILQQMPVVPQPISQIPQQNSLQIPYQTFGQIPHQNISQAPQQMQVFTQPVGQAQHQHASQFPQQAISDNRLYYQQKGETPQHIQVLPQQFYQMSQHDSLKLPQQIQSIPQIPIHNPLQPINSETPHGYQFLNQTSPQTRLPVVIPSEASQIYRPNTSVEQPLQTQSLPAMNNSINQQNISAENEIQHRKQESVKQSHQLDTPQKLIHTNKARSSRRSNNGLSPDRIPEINPIAKETTTEKYMDSYPKIIIHPPKPIIVKPYLDIQRKTYSENDQKVNDLQIQTPQPNISNNTNDMNQHNQLDQKTLVNQNKDNISHNQYTLPSQQNYINQQQYIQPPNTEQPFNPHFTIPTAQNSINSHLHPVKPDFNPYPIANTQNIVGSNNQPNSQVAGDIQTSISNNYTSPINNITPAAPTRPQIASQ